MVKSVLPPSVSVKPESALTDSLFEPETMSLPSQRGANSSTDADALSFGGGSPGPMFSSGDAKAIAARKTRPAA